MEATFWARKQSVYRPPLARGYELLHRRPIQLLNLVRALPFARSRASGEKGKHMFSGIGRLLAALGAQSIEVYEWSATDMGGEEW